MWARFDRQQLAAHPEMLKAAREKLILPTPIFDTRKTRIITSADEASGSGSGAVWAHLEEEALSAWDRKGKKPLRLLPDDSRRMAAVKRDIHVEVTASNPLNSHLVLSDVRAVFGDSEETTEAMDEITLEPYETRILSLPVQFETPGSYTLRSVKFNFHRFFPYEQELARKGKRLHATKQQRLEPTYAADTSLTVIVEKARPVMSASLDGPSDSVLLGEAVPLTLRIRNDGTIPFDRVQLFTDQASSIHISAGQCTISLQCCR